MLPFLLRLSILLFSLSPPVASLVCFSCWPPSLFVRVWLAVLPGAPSCLCLPFIHLLICFAARRATKFVSHRSGLVAVYMSKLDSLGENIWGHVGRDLAVVFCWWSLYLCLGFFSVAAELCILSSCWGWGRLLLCLFWWDCPAFSWGTCGFPLRVMQLATLLGFHT